MMLHTSISLFSQLISYHHVWNDFPVTHLISIHSNPRVLLKLEVYFITRGTGILVCSPTMWIARNSISHISSFWIPGLDRTILRIISTSGLMFHNGRREKVVFSKSRTRPGWSIMRLALEVMFVMVFFFFAECQNRGSKTQHPNRMEDWDKMTSAMRIEIMGLDSFSF